MDLICGSCRMTTAGHHESHCPMYTDTYAVYRTIATPDFCKGCAERSVLIAALRRDLEAARRLSREAHWRLAFAGSAVAAQIPPLELRPPDDPASSIAALLSKLTVEDKDTFNWIVKSAYAQGRRESEEEARR